MATEDAFVTHDQLTAEEFANILGTNPKICRYKIVGKLGAGTSGEVSLVERVSTGQRLVAKVTNLSSLPPKFRQHAASELQCLALCKHFTIIKYQEHFVYGDIVLLIMEFADAGDLSKQVKERAAKHMHFQEYEIGVMFLHLTMALHYLHSMKVLHRDVKSANVLLKSDGSIRLGDFGFSQLYEDTVSGAVGRTFCGTPYYIAPELWQKQRYGKKADMWALGVLLYEMMALKRPFVGSTIPEVMARVMEGKVDPLPENYSPGIKNIVSLLLAYNPELRPSAIDILRLPYMTAVLDAYERSVQQHPTMTEEVRADTLRDIEDLRRAKALPVITAPPTDAHGDVHFESVVQKSSGGVWKERILTLQSRQLKVTSMSAAEQSRNMPVSNVVEALPIATEVNRNSFVFGIFTGTGRAMFFKVDSHELLLRWLDAIYRAISKDSSMPPALKGTV